MIKALGVSVAFALGLALASSSAMSAFVQGTCAVTDVTASGNNATACLNYSGNNNNYQEGTDPAGYENYIAADFGVPGTWSFYGTSDPADPVDPVTNIVGGGQSGVWSVFPAVDSFFVVTIKAADFFAAYLFSGLSDVLGGTFSVVGATKDADPTKTKYAGLSHLSVYTGPVSPVPLPAALPLLMMGLGGIAWLGRRRNQKA